MLPRRTPGSMDTITLLQQEIATCNACPRLREYCAGVAARKVRRYQDQAYWGRPVPGFGDPAARLLILGLAPGAHGANRTGRMFTGDDSGLWLYGTLHEFGLATQPTATHRDDGLQLVDAYITNAVRCAPPDNQPLPEEATTCRPFLHRELELLPNVRVVLALGRFAFDAYLKLRKEQGHDVGRPEFAHGAVHRFPGTTLPVLLCSYHPSRQNTNTGVLTPAMWRAVFAQALKLMAQL